MFLSPKKKYSVYFMFLTLSGEKLYQNPVQFFPLFPVAYPFRIATQLQCYVKRVKCKLNDVIFPSGCKACAINLGNENVKIGIFTGGTSVRSKNIFTDISRYPTGKHEISTWYKHDKCSLALYRITKLIFRVVQIQKTCRRKNKCDSKLKFCFGKGKRHCGKKRK